MPHFQPLPDFEKNKKLLKLFLLLLKILHYRGYRAKYKEIRNFTTDARLSIISDIGS